MRAELAALFMVAAGTAQAAEIPLTRPYGTPAGCGNLRGIPPAFGEVLIATPRELLTSRLSCTFESVDPLAGGWRVSAACGEGENVAFRAIMEMTEGGGFLTIRLLSERGPEGIYPACEP